MTLSPALLPALRPIAQASAGQTVPTFSGLDSVAAIRELAHEFMRGNVAARTTPVPPAASEVDHRIAVDGGAITLRAYTPAGPGLFPVHLFFHGGGFWLGALDHSDNVCRSTSAGADCVVVSVDYRLAPQAKFPVPVEDCYRVLCWVVDHADQLGVDSTRVSVGGGSAGANFAAVLTLMARDRGGPALVGQHLEVPCTDLTMSQPSVTQLSQSPGLSLDMMTLCRDLYLTDLADATHPYASPLLAKDLAGLPSALVFTAEVDPLRSDGEAYALRLSEAGVPVELVLGRGQFHGSQHMSAVIPDEVAAYELQIATFLRRVHGT